MLDLSPEELKELQDLDPELFGKIVEATQNQIEEAVGDPYRASLFDKQLAFMDDPAKRKCAHPGRRSGKSWVIGTWLLEGGSTDPD